MTSRTVLITGAAQNIGAAIARDLHAHGMDVVLHYNRSQADAQALTAELNRKRADSACAVRGDLLDFASYGPVIQQTLAFKGQLDVLINNASSFFPTPMGKISQQDWQELIAVNMQAPLFLAQEAAPSLAERSGCIINLTDIHAERPLLDYAVYSAAKAGLVMLTRALARELAPAIRVNGIAPGAILWPENMPPAEQQHILQQVSLQRPGEPGDISKAVRYLVDDADYTTGQILTLDGGRTLYS